MLAGLDFFKKLMQYEKTYNSRGVQITNSLQTNGTLMDKEWADFFAENHFLVGVSIDGSKDLHSKNRIFADGSGSYDKAMTGIRHLCSSGVEYNILCVITAEAAQHGEEIYNALKEHQYLQFIPCIEGFHGEGSEFCPNGKALGQFLIDVFDCYERSWRQGKYVSVRNFDNYIGMLRGQRPEHCGMSGQCGIYYLAEANGDMYPCDFYVLDPWKLGNIATDPFVRLAKVQEQLGFVATSKHTAAKCTGCKWYPICRGGCRRDREPFENGMPGLNRYCEGYEVFFNYAFERLERLAKLG